MARDRKPAASDTLDAASLSFEAAIERLQTIVEELERGSLSLEESLARYEEGVKLSRRLTQTLDQAERSIERLSAGADGEPVTEPMESEDELVDEPKTAAKPVREPAKPGPREPDGSVGELPF